MVPRNPTYRKYFNTFKYYNKGDILPFSIRKRGYSFIRNKLEDINALCGGVVGQKVYSIIEKEGSWLFGFIGFLLSLEKLKSLRSFILNKAFKLGRYNI